MTRAPEDPQSAGHDGRAHGARVTETPQSPSRLFWLKGAFGAVGFATSLGLPTEFLAPLARIRRGDHGVQVGPTVAALLSPVANVAASRLSVRLSPPAQRLLERASVIQGVVAPVLAAGVPATVVLRGRSPLWAWVGAVAARVVMAALLDVSMETRMARGGRAGQ